MCWSICAFPVFCTLRNEDIKSDEDDDNDCNNDNNGNGNDNEDKNYDEENVQDKKIHKCKNYNKFLRWCYYLHTLREGLIF